MKVIIMSYGEKNIELIYDNKQHKEQEGDKGSSKVIQEKFTQIIVNLKDACYNFQQNHLKNSKRMYSLKTE